MSEKKETITSPNLDPIFEMYVAQMDRTLKIANILGGAISHLRSLQHMTTDSSTQKYIEGAIEEIQTKFKEVYNEK